MADAFIESLNRRADKLLATGDPFIDSLNKRAQGLNTLAPPAPPMPTVNLGNDITSQVMNSAVDTGSVATPPVASAPEGQFNNNGIGNVLAQTGKEAAASVVTAGSDFFGGLIEAKAVEQITRKKMLDAADSLPIKDRIIAHAKIIGQDLKPLTEGEGLFGLPSVDQGVGLMQRALTLPVEIAVEEYVKLVGPENAQRAVSGNRKFFQDIGTKITGRLTTDEWKEIGTIQKRLKTGHKSVESPEGEFNMTGPLMKMTEGDTARDEARMVELMTRHAQIPEELTEEWRRSANWWDKASSLDWWMLNGAQQAGPMGIFVLSMKGGARALSTNSARQLFTLEQMKKIGMVSSATTGSYASGMLEAGGHMTAQLDAGVPLEEAARQSRELFRSASAITFATSGIGAARAGFVRGKGAIAAGVVSEPVEEFLQNTESNKLSGRPLLEGATDAILLGLMWSPASITTVSAEVKRAQEFVFLQNADISRRALAPLNEGTADEKSEKVEYIEKQRESINAKTDELRHAFRQEDLDSVFEELDAMQSEQLRQQLAYEEAASAALADPTNRNEEIGTEIEALRIELDQVGSDPNEKVRLNTEIARLEKERADSVTDISDPATNLQREVEDITGVRVGRNQSIVDAERQPQSRSAMGPITQGETGGVPGPKFESTAERQARRERQGEALSPLARREAEQRAFERMFSLTRGSDYHFQLMRVAVDMDLLDQSQAIRMDPIKLSKLITGSRVKIPVSLNISEQRQGKGASRQADLEVAFTEDEKAKAKAANIARATAASVVRQRLEQEAGLQDAFFFGSELDAEQRNAARVADKEAELTETFNQIPIRREGMTQDVFVNPDEVVLHGETATTPALTDEELRANREAGLSFILPVIPTDTAEILSSEGVRDFWIANENADITKLTGKEIRRMAKVADVKLGKSDSKSQMVAKVDDAIKQGLLAASRRNVETVRAKQAAEPVVEASAETTDDSPILIPSKYRRPTINNINRFLPEGVEVDRHDSGQSFFFTDGSLYDATVGVSRLSDMTVKEWVEEYRNKVKETKERSFPETSAPETQHVREIKARINATWGDRTSHDIATAKGVTLKDLRSDAADLGMSVMHIQSKVEMVDAIKQVLGIRPTVEGKATPTLPVVAPTTETVVSTDGTPVKVGDTIQFDGRTITVEEISGADGRVLYGSVDGKKVSGIKIPAGESVVKTGGEVKTPTLPVVAPKKAAATIEAFNYEESETATEDAENAELLAELNDINILSNKELTLLAKDADGDLVGAAWTSLDNSSGEFSVDIVVDPESQRQGIGGQLMDAALDDFTQIKEAVENAHIKLDAVTAEGAALAKSRGFTVESGQLVDRSTPAKTPTLPVVAPKPTGKPSGNLNARAEQAIGGKIDAAEFVKTTGTAQLNTLSIGQQLALGSRLGMTEAEMDAADMAGNMVGALVARAGGESAAVVAAKEATQTETLWTKLDAATTVEEVTELVSGLTEAEVLDFTKRFDAAPGDKSLQLNALQKAVFDPTTETEAGDAITFDEIVDDLDTIIERQEFLAELDVESVRAIAEEAGVAIRTKSGGFRAVNTLVNGITTAAAKARKGREAAATAAAGKKTAPEAFIANLEKLSNNPSRSVEVGDNVFLSQGKLPDGSTVYWTHDELYNTVEHVPTDEAVELMDEHAKGNQGPSIDHLLSLDEKAFNAAFKRTNPLWRLRLAEQMGISTHTKSGERKDSAIQKTLKAELQAQRDAAKPDLKPPKQDTTLKHLLDEPTKAGKAVMDMGVSTTADGIVGSINELATNAVHRKGDATQNHTEAGRILERLRTMIGHGKPSELGTKIRGEVDLASGNPGKGSVQMGLLRRAFSAFAEAHRVVGPINKVTRLTRQMGMAMQGPDLKTVASALKGLENIHANGVDAWNDAVSDVNSIEALPDAVEIDQQNESMDEATTEQIEILQGQLDAMADAGVPPSNPERASIKQQLTDILMGDPRLGFANQDLVTIWEAINKLSAGGKPVDANTSPALYSLGATIKEGVDLERKYNESVAAMMDPESFSKKFVEEFESPTLNKAFTQSPLLTARQLKNSFIVHTANNLYALEAMRNHIERMLDRKLTTLEDPFKRAVLSRGAPGRADVLTERWSKAVRSAWGGSGGSVWQRARFTEFVFARSIIRREAAARSRYNRYQALKLDAERLVKGVRTTKGKITSLTKKARKTATTDVEATALRAERDVKHKELKGLEAEQRGIQQAMKLLSDRLVDTDNFDATTINPNGQTAETAQQALDELKAILGDDGFAQYEKAAKDVNAVWSDLLDYATDAGLISQADRQHMVDTQTHNGDYLGPFNVLGRFADGGLDQIHQSSLSVVGQDVFKAEKGTILPVGDMLGASIDRIFKTTGFGERNKAVRELGRLRADAEVELKQLTEAGDSRATSLKNGPLAVLDMIQEKKEGEEAPPGYENVFYMDDGVAHQLWVAAPIAGAVQGMNRVQANWLMKMTASGNSLLRLGATAANLTFSFVNVPRDLATQYLAADTPLKFYDPRDWYILAESFLQMFTPEMMRTQNAQAVIDAWKQHGGGFSSMVSQIKPERRALEMVGSRASQATTLNQVSDITSLGPLGMLKNSLSLLTHFAEAAEGGTRLGLFKKELRQDGNARKRTGLGTGLGTTTEGVDMESFARAAYASRTGTIDFAQGGTWFQTLNYFSPFINAAAQGSRVMIEGAKDHPLRAAAFASMGILASSMLMLSDYEEFGFEMVEKVDPKLRKKSFSKVVGTYIDPRSGEELPHVISFPKGDFLAMITAPIDGMIRAAYEKDISFDEVLAGDWQNIVQNALLATASDISPIEFVNDQNEFDVFRAISTPLPVPLRGLMEIGLNKNFYFNKDIEFPSELSRKPKLRYRPTTSLAARQISEWSADIFGEHNSKTFSPIQIDHAASAFASSIGRGLLAAPEVLGMLENTNPGVEDRVSVVPGTSAERVDDVNFRGLPDFLGIREAAEGVADMIGREKIVALSLSPMVRAFYSTRNRGKDNELYEAYKRGSQDAQSLEFLQTEEVKRLIADAGGGRINSAQLEAAIAGYSASQQEMLVSEYEKTQDPSQSARRAKYRTLQYYGTDNGERAYAIATAFKDVIKNKEERASFALELVMQDPPLLDSQIVGQLQALGQMGYWDGDIIGILDTPAKK